MIRDDISETEFKENYSIPTSNLNFRNTVKEAIDLLEKGEAEILVYEYNATMYTLKALKLDISQYETVAQLSNNELYFAVSKDVDESSVRLLEDAFSQISEPEKQEIINKY